MNPELRELWVYLSTSPLLGLTLTLLAYQLAYAIYVKLGSHPLANPVAIAVALIVAILSFTGTPYAIYFEGAQFVHFLLGPATVALAVPLYAQWPRLKKLFGASMLALVTGSVVSVVSVWLIAEAFGASDQVLRSLAPKSVTSPIGMGISEKIGGLPSLTAVLIMLTGIVGAVIGPALLKATGTQDDAMRGFAIGISAHGIGTARAFQISETAGAFSALAMGLNGVVTSIVVPLLVHGLA
ncbi:LrgB family protein [Methyloversatilis sp.]|uniref:LrgB family protein n=1 Tax=Methyloversatilis sp. TaxID=2569862 RepID=UPI002732485C|nr:LrgB family protein [Methyloversatilis sp.]MDP2867369.1 LrgB family protein [Methyloversatilis sp.]MDP3288508.1 LrgB family protein [Methyloversatilis sp.]MDP3454433.1 LrgB family protein [Methyloversatilis sp.]MDP3577583.1 LrgB family protein [Methyloversatilis sp.]